MMEEAVSKSIATYSGKVVGQVCVLEGKRHKMLSSINPTHRFRANVERQGLVGVGNSVYDAPFLEEIPPASAAVVRPGRRLRHMARTKGWDHSSFAHVRGTGASPTPDPLCP